MPVNNKQGFPGLDRIKDQALHIPLRALWDAVSSLKGRGGSTISLEGPVTLGGFKISGVADPTADSDVVTKGYADATYGAEATRIALSVAGTNPLLTGVAVAPDAKVFYAAHNDRINLSTYSAGTVPDGSLLWETDRTVLYQVQLVAGVPTWVYLVGVMVGTLAPDLKPTDLGTADTFFRFYSTDYNRSYQWTGSAWADDVRNGAPQRGMIAYFSDTAPPDGGPSVWALCDGTAVTISTSTGGTAAFTTPDLVTLGSFIRSTGGATGGTGGAITHVHDINPPNTTSGAPSGTVEVQSGTGVDVADDSHTHDTDIGTFASAAGDSLPPYVELNPYIRL